MAEDGQTNGEDGGESKAGGGRKLLIFGLLGGLVIGGGATFGTLMFLGEDEEGAEEAAQMAEEEALPEDTSAFIPLNRIPASLTSAGGDILGYVFLDLSFEVADEESRDWLNERIPILRDAVLRSIARGGVAPPGKPAELDYDGVTNRLREAANNALGQDVIVRVLIINSVQQMN